MFEYPSPNFIMKESSNINKIYLMSDYDMIKGRCGQEVKYPKDYDIPKNSKGKYTPHQHGLYDPKIFGYPNQCKCPKKYRTVYEGTITKCKTCRCEVMSEDEYLERYTTYSLNSPYISLLKLPALCIEIKKIFGEFPNGLKPSLQSVWSLYLYTDSSPFTVQGLGKNGDKYEMDSRLFIDKNGNEVWVAIMDLPGLDPNDVPKKDNRGNDISVENMGLFGLKKLSQLYFPDGRQCNILGDLINYKLIVTSPGRQSRRGSLVPMKDGKVKLAIGSETLDYYAIMNYNLQIANYLKNDYLSITDKATYCWFMNVMVNAHFANNEILQSSKQSLARTNLDTRVKASLRALIVASLDLPMDTVGIPETFAYATLQKTIIDEIENRLKEEKPDIVLDAKELYLKKDPFAIKVFHEIVETHYDENGDEIVPAMCKLVRNPSLHKWNMTSFKIKLVNDTAIH